MQQCNSPYLLRCHLKWEWAIQFVMLSIIALLMSSLVFVVMTTTSCLLVVERNNAYQNELTNKIKLTPVNLFGNFQNYTDLQKAFYFLQTSWFHFFHILTAFLWNHLGRMKYVLSQSSIAGSKIWRISGWAIVTAQVALKCNGIMMLKAFWMKFSYHFEIVDDGGFIWNWHNEM